MMYNELEQGNILSEVRVGLASIAYTDISLCSIWAIYRIRQTPKYKQFSIDSRRYEFRRNTFSPGSRCGVGENSADIVASFQENGSCS